MYEGRMGYTQLRHLLALLFAVAFVAIILFSRQSYGALFGLDPSVSPQNALSSANQIPDEPVVFALIMYSESSAKEGAILMKVLPCNSSNAVSGL
jgi:hypothetical protein